jgi:tetratricopeptide (TPR) repeat protein
MDKNNLFHDRYFLERLLGRGNFSEVWLANDIKTDIQVALKIYAPATGLDDHGMNVLSREFAIVVSANQKNLLKPLYYDSYERKPYLVLPYCKNGTIQRLIGKFSEEDAWKLFRDVAAGLAYLHSMNPTLIHQDIKPDNIMIGDNGTYMITDFGVSAHAKSTLRKSLSTQFASAGTTAYMAPERFSKDNTPIKANDIWSLGAMVYEMVTGDVPFSSGTHIEGGILQKNGAEIPDLPGTFSPELNQMIQMCLNENPWDRPTAEQIVEYAQIAIDGGNPFPGPDPWYVKYKVPLYIISAICAAALLVGLTFWLRPAKVVDPVEELTGLPKAAYLMKESSTSKDGFDQLNSMVNEGDASAIYLLSRLYFGKINNEYDPDSIRNMRQVLLDDQLITTDFEKAHALLLKTLEKDPKEYHALYELGRDCLAGNNREHEVELGPEDFKTANDYFTKALEYAKEANDIDYVERIKEQLEMIKTVI